MQNYVQYAAEEDCHKFIQNKREITIRQLKRGDVADVDTSPETANSLVEVTMMSSEFFHLSMRPLNFFF